MTVIVTEAGFPVRKIHNVESVSLVGSTWILKMIFSDINQVVEDKYSLRLVKE